MSHLDTIARRKVSGSEDWKVFGWKRIGGGNDVRGGAVVVDQVMRPDLVVVGLETADEFD